MRIRSLLCVYATKRSRPSTLPIVRKRSSASPRRSSVHSTAKMSLNTSRAISKLTPWCAGLPCLDHSPPAPWPSWLVGLINPPKPSAPRRERPRRQGDDDAAVDAVTRIARNAAEGELNGKLFWAANRMRERDATRSAAEAILIPAAREAGPPDFEVRRTIASAWRGA